MKNIAIFLLSLLFITGCAPINSLQPFDEQAAKFVRMHYGVKPVASRAKPTVPLRGEG